MPPAQISEAVNIINLLFVVVTFLLGVVSAFFFFVLRGIKSNVDSIRKTSEENRNRAERNSNEIAKIKGKLDIE